MKKFKITVNATTTLAIVSSIKITSEENFQFERVFTNKAIPIEWNVKGESADKTLYYAEVNSHNNGPLFGELRRALPTVICTDISWVLDTVFVVDMELTVGERDFYKDVLNEINVTGYTMTSKDSRQWH